MTRPTKALPHGGQDCCTNIAAVKDAKSGKVIIPDAEAYCKKVKDSPSGFWKEYWWPKPGEKEPSRRELLIT
jgi:hypothetical protein